MQKLVNLFKKYKTFISYAFFGVCTTVINILAYYVFYTILEIPNIPATIISWFISCVFAFVTNKFYVFSSKSLTIKVLLYEVGTFFLGRIGTGLFDTGFMWLTVDVLHAHAILMKAISNVIVIILNYVFSRLFIFNKKRVQKTNSEATTAVKENENSEPIEDSFYGWWLQTKARVCSFCSALKNVDRLFIFATAMVSLIFFCVFFVQFLPYAVDGAWITYPLFINKAGDNFQDLFPMIYFSGMDSPYINGNFYTTQPPFIYILCRILYFIMCSPGEVMNRDIIYTYWPARLIAWLYVIGFVVLLAILLHKVIKKNTTTPSLERAIIIIFLVSCGPLFFGYQRGNHLMYSLLFVGYYFAYRNSEKRGARIFALLSLCFAISTKLILVLFLGELLYEKRFKDLIYSVIITGLIYLVSFVMLGGPLIESIKAFIERVKDYDVQSFYHHNIALTNLFQLIGFEKVDGSVLFSIGRKVSYVVAMFAGFAFFFTKEKWKRLALISLVIIAFPANSFEYYGGIMIIPLICLLVSGKKTKFSFVYLGLILFSLTGFQFGMYIPESESFMFGVPNSSLVRGIVLTTILILLIFDPLVSFVITSIKRSKEMQNNSVEAAN